MDNTACNYEIRRLYSGHKAPEPNEVKLRGIFRQLEWAQVSDVARAVDRLLLEPKLPTGAALLAEVRRGARARPTASSQHSETPEWTRDQFIDAMKQHSDWRNPIWLSMLRGETTPRECSEQLIAGLEGFAPYFQADDAAAARRLADFGYGSTPPDGRVRAAPGPLAPAVSRLTPNEPDLEQPGWES